MFEFLCTVNQRMNLTCDPESSFIHPVNTWTVAFLRRVQIFLLTYLLTSDCISVGSTSLEHGSCCWPKAIINNNIERLIPFRPHSICWIWIQWKIEWSGFMGVVGSDVITIRLRLWYWCDWCHFRFR